VDHVREALESHRSQSRIQSAEVGKVRLRPVGRVDSRVANMCERIAMDQLNHVRSSE